MDIVYNLFFMFGGVAAMMLGMKIMGGGLEKFAGSNMKKLLGKVTTNRFAGVGVGLAVTSIIQSSTATTVMLVGFVNIGLMTLAQATNVIMGANIGTTVTAHLVSLAGVGAIDIGAIAALIGFGGVMLAMLIKNDKVANIGNILAGLGLIFVGLEFISIYAQLIMFENTKGIFLLDINGEKIPHEWVATIFQGGHFPLLLVLIGIVITALVHSSSTITSLMVVLASIGVLSFENALFLALGSNIGTCITSIMSSAGTCVNAKRTAVVHLLFNTLGCVLFIVPIWIWSADITALFASISGDVGQQIAIFHTMFNVVTTLILLPFANVLVKLVCKIIPEKQQSEADKFKFSFIDNRMLQTPPIAVGNIRREVVKMGEIAKENIISSIDMLLDADVDNEKIIREREENLNWLNRNVTAYLTKLMSKDLSATDDKKVGSYYHVVSDIERVGDYAENIMEYALKLREESMSFSEEAVQELRNMTKTVCELFDFSFTAFDERDVSMLDKVCSLEESLDDMTMELETKHIERVKKGACTAQLGSVYLQTVSNLERVGDHINNVAISIKKYSHA